MTKVLIRTDGVYPDEVLCKNKDVAERFIALEKAQSGGANWTIVEGPVSNFGAFAKTLNAGSVTRLSKLSGEDYESFLTRNGYLSGE